MLMPPGRLGGRCSRGFLPARGRKAGVISRVSAPLAGAVRRAAWSSCSFSYTHSWHKGKKKVKKKHRRRKGERSDLSPFISAAHQQWGAQEDSS